MNGRAILGTALVLLGAVLGFSIPQDIPIGDPLPYGRGHDIPQVNQIGMIALALLLVFLGLLVFPRRNRERLILEILEEQRQCPDGVTGLDLIALSDGVLRRGTVYVYLSRLGDRGAVRFEEGEDGRRRYWITPAGLIEFFGLGPQDIPPPNRPPYD